MNDLDLVIIGSGPGGYVAAIRAAQLGQQVTLIEKNVIGGTCLNVGCVPSKALLNAGHHYVALKQAAKYGITATGTLDFTQTQTWKNTQVVDKLRMGVSQLLKKNKVSILKGEARFSGKNTLTVISEGKSEDYRFKNAIIATGSAPIELKVAPFGKRIVDSTGLLNIESLPATLAIIGAGYIGTELSEAFACFGTKVMLMESESSILPGFDTKISNLVMRNLTKSGVEILTQTKVLEAQSFPDHVSLTYQTGEIVTTTEVELVMVSVGRKPTTAALNLGAAGITADAFGKIPVNPQGRTENPHVYAIGDVVKGLPLAHKASYEAKIVVRAIAGHQVSVDYKAMPAVCYTTPEIATTGKTVDEATAAGFTAKSTDFPLAANSRAIAANRTDGFVRIVHDEKSHVILGAQIVGESAGEIITTITLAIETGLTLEDIALTIFPHPTVSEAIMDNTEVGLGFPIHV
jgi:dihydrolipoamide dehydrogenase